MRRLISESGAPASTSAAATRRVRAVALGWAKVAVSMTMPAARVVASAPSPHVRGTPRRTARRVTISHVAAAVGSIQARSPAPSLLAW